jgi:predicted transcriptional regulator
MPRRSRYDIFLDILDACRERQTVTSILRKCGLSWNQRDFLVHLNHYGFLKKQGDFYKTTDEGRRFFREFEKFIIKLNP